MQKSNKVSDSFVCHKQAFPNWRLTVVLPIKVAMNRGWIKEIISPPFYR